MTTIPPLSSLEACFGDRADPHVVGRCNHKLIEIIVVAVCAVVWDGNLERSGGIWQRKGNRGATLLERPAGSPSHDPFSRVVRLVAARAFQERFLKWVETHFTLNRDQVMTVEGKTARGSRDNFRGQGAIH